MESVMRARALAQAASCTTSTSGSCAGPPAMPRSPLLAKVQAYTRFIPSLYSTRLSLNPVCIMFTLH